ncbi:Uncharacterized protein QTN25_003406 [Entamoeba marina]
MPFSSQTLLKIAPHIPQLLLLCTYVAVAFIFLSFFTAFVNTEETQVGETFDYTSYLTKFCIVSTSDIVKHTCVDYIFSSGFFDNLPTFTSNGTLFTFITICNIVICILATVFFMIELFAFLSSKDPKYAVQSHIIKIFEFIQKYVPIPELPPTLIVFSIGILFAVSLGLFELITVVLSIIAVSTTDFNDEATVVGNESLCFGFWSMLIGFILLQISIWGTIVSRLIYDKFDESPTLEKA